MRLEITAIGEPVVARGLLRFADQMEHPETALRLVADQLRANALAQFDTQGGHGSGGWKPIAAATLRAKMRKGQDPRILRATERLRNSLISKDGEDHVEELLSPNTLRFASRVPYARFHQTGTRRMAARHPIDLTETDRREIVKVVQRHVIETVRGAA